MVGAGLKVSDALRPGPAVLLPDSAQAGGLPVIMIALALGFGLSGRDSD
jgi:malonate transporter